MSEPGGALTELWAAITRRIAASFTLGGIDYGEAIYGQAEHDRAFEADTEAEAAQHALDAALSALEARIAKFTRFVRATDYFGIGRDVRESATADHAAADSVIAASEELRDARAALSDEDVA